MSRLTVPGVVVAVVVIAIALVFGCGGSGDGDQRARLTEGAPPGVAAPMSLEAEAVSGTLYTLANPFDSVSFDAAFDIYRWTAGDERPFRLTEGGRALSVSARGDDVVAGVDQAVRASVVRLDPRAMNTLPKTSIGKGSVPDLGPGGKVAFDEYRQGPAGAFTVAVVTDLRGSRRRIVFRRGIIDLEWMPSGELLVLYRRGGRARIAFVRRGRVVKSMRSPRGAFRMRVSLRGRLLVLHSRGASLRTGPGWRAIPRSAGWSLLAWSPDEQRLLVTDEKRGRVALISLRGEVRQIGSVEPGAILSAAAWVPQEIR